eukprot:gnl/TRDRNA2_/TRDRNA2_170753_c0_seq3.p1 gnl/TRDRNA2_/TRDRNA2_170753_c0~~gnl/TRDRNA2_/TRDRNA2_170753_c0_seq3.p1  ORF type:complete len:102 (-),score=25.38 gnl/TRDRNA2_/TRDRNA2_170753_c0_seq3:174-479(-)
MAVAFWDSVQDLEDHVKIAEATPGINPYMLQEAINRLLSVRQDERLVQRLRDAVQDSDIVELQAAVRAARMVRGVPVDLINQALEKLPASVVKTLYETGSA